MKHFFAMLLAAALIFSMAACGTGSPSDSDSSTEESSTGRTRASSDASSQGEEAVDSKVDSGSDAAGDGIVNGDFTYKLPTDYEVYEFMGYTFYNKDDGKCDRYFSVDFEELTDYELAMFDMLFDGKHTAEAEEYFADEEDEYTVSFVTVHGYNAVEMNGDDGEDRLGGYAFLIDSYLVILDGFTDEATSDALLQDMQDLIVTIQHV